MKILILSENKIISLVFIFITSFLYYSNEKLKVQAYDLLGSKFLPRIVCIAIIILSIMLFFAREKQEEKIKDEVLQKFSYKSLALFLILSFVYLLALNYHFGFSRSTFIYLIIFVFILDNHKFKELPKIILFSLISTYIIYYFFQIFLQLLLP